MSLLTTGNTAKLYCLNWLEKYLTDHPAPIRILDLGCGEGLNFVKLLQKYAARVSYTGIEPDEKNCQLARENLRGLPATVIKSYGYKLSDKLSGEYDFVVSFSVLEHVFRRLAYLKTVKEYLAPAGYFLINYDAGHFVAGRERLKNMVGPFLALFGLEKYYQSFVKEEDFCEFIDLVGLKIIDQKFFNTKLKGVAKIISPANSEEFMGKWFNYELWLNSLDIEYVDALAPIFETRNFIIRHKNK